jgi:hypothetical protein
MATGTPKGAAAAAHAQQAVGRARGTRLASSGAMPRISEFFGIVIAMYDADMRRRRISTRDWDRAARGVPLAAIPPLH